MDTILRAIEEPQEDKPGLGELLRGLLKQRNLLVQPRLSYREPENIAEQEEVPVKSVKKVSPPKDDPRILKIAPELPSDSEGLKIHKQNYKNVNGPEYVRKVGGVKTSELDGNGITNEIFNEIGDFDLMDEQIPNHSKKTNIPY